MRKTSSPVCYCLTMFFHIIQTHIISLCQQWIISISRFTVVSFLQPRICSGRPLWCLAAAWSPVLPLHPHPQFSGRLSHTDAECTTPRCGYPCLCSPFAWETELIKGSNSKQQLCVYDFVFVSTVAPSVCMHVTVSVFASASVKITPKMGALYCDKINSGLFHVSSLIGL